MRGRLLLCVGASGLLISPYNPRAQFKAGRAYILLSSFAVFKYVPFAV